MYTRLAMTRDINGFNSFGLTFSNIGYQTILSDGVQQQLFIPNMQNVSDKKYLAIFGIQPGTNVYVALNNNADLPLSSFTITGTTLNPTSREVSPGDFLSFITDSSFAVVNVQLYAIQ